MRQKDPKFIPEIMEKSVYVFPFTQDTTDLPHVLIEILPKNSSFIRRSTTADLALVTKTEDGLPHFTKKSITVLSRKPGITTFTAIFLGEDNKTPFTSLAEFSINRNLVLNFIPNEAYVQKKTEKDLRLSTIDEIIDKINLFDLLNDTSFYTEHIKKEEKITFPKVKVMEIILLKDNIYLLKMDNDTLALMSKNQLLAAKNYTLKLHEPEKSEFSSSPPRNIPENALLASTRSQTLFSSPKRKPDNDLGNTPKRIKTEEKEATENMKNKGDVEKPSLKASNSLVF